jgi:Na+-driven multidrug efflux pump
MISIFIPFIIGFGFLYWSSILDEEHVIVKMFFQLLFIPFALLGIHFGVIEATLVYASDPELVVQLANTAYYLSIILYFVGALLLLWLGKRVYDTVMATIQEGKDSKYE